MQAPHILLVLLDDWGYANAGWHRNYSAPGGGFVYGEVLSVDPAMHREYQEAAQGSRPGDPLPTTDFALAAWLRRVLEPPPEQVRPRPCCYQIR